MGYAMQPKIHPDTFIADNAVIIGDVTIEKGVSIWYGAVLRGDEASIHVGEGSNIQDNAVVHVYPERPVSIGKNCSIGHGAIVHGCTLHDYVIVGINATVLDKANIHSYSIIGANALVKEGQVIPQKSLAVGVPAKIVRENDPEIRKVTEYNAEAYYKLRDEHLQGVYKRFRKLE